MKIKHVLVALDLTEMDERLIKFTCFLDKMFDFDTIHFLHVAKTLEYPEEVLKNHPELLAPLDDTYKHKIEEELSSCWGGAREKAQLKVADGNPEEGLLKWARIKDADLIVLGRKSTMKGTGLIPGKVTRAAHCSVLLVPEQVNYNIRKIMMSVDFSRHSLLVAEQCIHLAKKIEGAKLIMFHVYQVPSGYSKTGKSFEEFSEIMKGHAMKDSTDFIKKLELEGIDHEFIYKCDDEQRGPMDEILKYANNEKVEMLAVGSKGRTNAASFLLGSLAEKLVNENSTIPFLVVKQKGSNMSFLDAIFKL
jgi:nucleotide-binding universal stress UspA family protein